MKATGELLKKSRLEQNLSLEELSAQTKIQVSILRKMEEGLSSQLPHKTIVRGFVKHYAKCIQLNVDEVIALYDSEMSSAPAPVVAATVAVPQKSSNPAQNTIGDKTNLLWFRTSSSFVTLLGIGTVVILIGAIYFFSVKMISYSEETYHKPQAETETATPAELTTLVAPPIEKKPEVVEAVQSKPDNSTPPKEEKKEAATTTAKKEDDKKEEKKEEEEEVKDEAVINTPKMVVVEAFETVSIAAEWSTGKKEKINLKTNRKHTFYYSDKISLKIDNAGGVNIVTANDKVGIPGELGQEVTLAFE
ncbi:MAG: helix-turn-helix domain-containing protein [Bdellovibrionales bacterium]|nr:helix-turn-helix domain-containing protein [Bdellovibrionales bacterium]